MKNLFWLLAFAALPLTGADYYLDNVKGNDANDGASGAPMATFKALESKLKPGDTVYLAPTGELYRQDFVFRKAAGSEGQPITVEGNQQTVSGARTIGAGEWQPAGEERFKVTGAYAEEPGVSVLATGGKAVYARLDRDALLPGEWCYAVREKLLYYLPAKGEELKGRKFEATLPDGSKVELDPARFERSHSKIGALRYRGLAGVSALTIDGKAAVQGDLVARLEPGEWCRIGLDIYYRPAAGAQGAPECELFVRGVGFGLYSTDIVVRNVNVRHVWNDGFNIHGRGKNYKLLNCNAYQCGDEGVSAHGTCEIELDGAVIRECENGINHVMDSHSVSRNVYIADCWGNGLEYQLGAAANHRVENLVLVNNFRQFTWGGSGEAPVVLEGVLAIGDGARQGQIMLNGGKTEVTNLTVIAQALRFQAGPSMLKLRQAAFYVPKLEFDLRGETAKFFEASDIEVPAGSILHNRFVNRRDLPGEFPQVMSVLTLPSPFSPEAALAAAAAKGESKPIQLYKQHQK